jgi:hypothetical protein
MVDEAEAPTVLGVLEIPVIGGDCFCGDMLKKITHFQMLLTHCDLPFINFTF